MPSPRLACLSLFVALVTTCFPPPAAAELPQEQLQGQMEQMAFQMSRVPGMMIGIVSGKDEALLCYGEMAKGNGTAPSAETLWPIGSVSKVFTTQILAAMVAKGEVKLTDPLEMYLPKGTKVPEKDGRKITLLDLATHTAGLPRTIISEEEYEKAGDYANPAYAMDRALAWLGKNQLTHAPGTHYQYSNYGFGLLGQALARQRGVTFDELVRQYYGQFGMADTSATPTPLADKRRMSSYWMDGQEIKPDWPFNFEQPSGGVYASGKDMLKFLRLCLSQPALQVKGQPALRGSNTLAHACYVYRSELDNGITFADSGMALGWHVVDAHNGLPTLIHKNGWVSGFNTWIVLVPGEDIAVFSMSNQPYLMMRSTLETLIRTVIAAREK